jgi:hypothetical protein
MIAIDMQPLSVVSDSGFKLFLNRFEKGYKLPAASTLKSNLLPQRYTAIKSVLLS